MVTYMEEHTTMKKIALAALACLSLGLVACNEGNASTNTSETQSQSISILTRDTEISIGQTITLTYRADGEVGFSSSDESIATVDDYGQVKGIGEGTVVITAYLVDNPDVKAEITFTVYKPFFLYENGYYNGNFDLTDEREGTVYATGNQVQLLVNELGEEWYFSCHIERTGYVNNDPLGRFGVGSFLVDTLHPIGNNMFWFGFRPTGDGSSGLYTPYYGGWRYEPGMTSAEYGIDTNGFDPSLGFDVTIMRSGLDHYFYFEQGEVKFGYSVAFFDGEETYPGIYSQNQELTITDFEASSDHDVVIDKLNEFQTAESVSINGLDNRLEPGIYDLTATVLPEVTPIKDVAYSLYEPHDGVTCSEDGRLVISDGASGTFRVVATSINNPNAKQTKKFQIIDSLEPSGRYEEELAIGDGAKLEGDNVVFDGTTAYMPVNALPDENVGYTVDLTAASGKGRYGVMLAEKGYFQYDYAEIVVGEDESRILRYGNYDHSYEAEYALPNSAAFDKATELGLYKLGGTVYVTLDGRLFKSFASCTDKAFPVVYSDGVKVSDSGHGLSTGELTSEALDLYGDFFVGGYVGVNDGSYSLSAVDIPGGNMNWPPDNDYLNGLKYKEALKGELDIRFTISDLTPMLSGDSYDSKVLVYLQSESPTCSLQLVIKGGKDNPTYALCPNFDDATWVEYPLEEYGIDFSKAVEVRIVKKVEGLEVYLNGTRVLEDCDGLLNDDYDWSNDTLSTPGIGTFRCGATLSGVEIAAYTGE